MIPAGMFRNMASGGLSSIYRGMGVVGRRTALGAVAGGMYGATSNDTSILGGMVMGGLGARYIGAGLKRASIAGRGLGFRGNARAYGIAFGRGVVGRAKLDYRGVRLRANRGMKGWMGGV